MMEGGLSTLTMIRCFCIGDLPIPSAKFCRKRKEGRRMNGMVMQLVSQLPSSGSHLLFNGSLLNHFSSPKIHATQISSTSRTIARRSLSLFALTSSFSSLIFFSSTNSTSWSKTVNLEFVELPDSGGVRALDLRIGDGEIPVNGDKVAIHYYGRLAAKQGWRFDSTYDHKDETGEAIPFEFILGTGKVISGIESAVRSMRVGGIRRVIIPPSEGYQNTLQEPIPPNFFDRQRLFTTIFNPTRLANGEGSTLGTLIFDIELVSLRHQ